MRHLSLILARIKFRILLNIPRAESPLLVIKISKKTFPQRCRMSLLTVECANKTEIDISTAREQKGQRTIGVRHGG